MILVDTALSRRHEEGRPIRVGLVGAGFMGRPIARRLATEVDGIRLAGFSNRHRDVAATALQEAGVDDAVVVGSVEAVEAAVDENRTALVDDPMLLCRADGIDAIVEVTGTLDFAAGVVLEAIAHAKHVVVMNAELDGTVGPLLKAKADEAGVVFTNADGDQPGVIMNLHRFVTGLGCRVRLLGNIKGLQDPYRTPTTQADFARRWGQTPHMVTSFADGTKVNFEMAVVANATGFGVARRGMLAPEVPSGTDIEDIADHFPVADLVAGEGIVDYCIGASPNAGVFALATHDDPVHRHYLNLYKVGEGPLYCFYNPFHLCHFEVDTTVVRAVEFGDATCAPLAAPRVDVVAVAKRDLDAGEVLDGLGHYTTYGECENHAAAREQGLLPIGLAEGARLKRPRRRDEVLHFDDVDMPSERLRDRLWDEQVQRPHPRSSSGPVRP